MTIPYKQAHCVILSIHRNRLSSQTDGFKNLSNINSISLRQMIVIVMYNGRVGVIVNNFHLVPLNAPSPP